MKSKTLRWLPNPPPPVHYPSYPTTKIEFLVQHMALGLTYEAALKKFDERIDHMAVPQRSNTELFVKKELEDILIKLYDANDKFNAQRIALILYLLSPEQSKHLL